MSKEKPVRDKEPKKEPYMSMDPEERDMLRTLGLRERVLYTELKWLANFKTGYVQQFSNRVVTYQFLADLITVPTTQGRAADTMNAKEACRVLMKLVDAGLVGEIKNDPKRGLEFALPMSPICKITAKATREAELAEALEAVKTAPKLPIEAAKTAPKLPIQARLISPANPITTGVSKESTPPLSVMKNFKEVQYNFHTDLANIVAAHGTATDRDMVALISSQKQSLESLAYETRGATANILTLEMIQERLRKSESGFSWIERAESMVIYRRWIAANHSPERFEEAVCAVEKDVSVEPTPRAVDSALRNPDSKRDDMLRAEQRARRKGGVQL
jgi:hypothetical protein